MLCYEQIKDRRAEMKWLLRQLIGPKAPQVIHIDIGWSVEVCNVDIDFPLVVTHNLLPMLQDD